MTTYQSISPQVSAAYEEDAGFPLPATRRIGKVLGMPRH